MNLYKLTEEIKLAEKMVEDWAEAHEGDITDCPMDKILDKLQMDSDEKALNCGIWYKNLIAEAEALKDEMDKLAIRRKTLVNKAESLKKYVQDFLPKGTKLKNSKCVIGWRKSTKISIPSELKPEFVKGILKTMIVKTKEEFKLKACADYIKTKGKLVIECGEGDDKFCYEIKSIEGQNVQIK